MILGAPVMLLAAGDAAFCSACPAPRFISYTQVIFVVIGALAFALVVAVNGLRQRWPVAFVCGGLAGYGAAMALSEISGLTSFASPEAIATAAAVGAALLALRWPKTEEAWRYASWIGSRLSLAWS